MTLINEPEKHPSWANGFTQNFPMPRNQDLSSIQTLIDRLISANNDSQLIIVDHYTDQTQSASFERISEKVAFIKFLAGGGSTGVYYRDALDDFCYKLIISAAI